ncbi:MAG: hypothetical protein ACJA2S_005056, partial [Cyclobacteriaceae bacterium]
SLSSLFLALGLMKFNTNLSQVKVFARFCLSKQTLNKLNIQQFLYTRIIP